MSSIETRPKSTYVCPDGTPFEVEWPDEESQGFGWRWDQMHNPLPFTPLAEELAEDTFEGFSRGMDVTGAAMHPASPLYVHGYRFQRFVRFDDDPAVRAGIAARDVQRRSERLIECWNADYLPETEALTRSILTWDNPRWSLREALDHFGEVRAARRRHGELHTLAMGLTALHPARLTQLCQEEFGAEADILAAQLAQGYPNRSLDSANALWALSRTALGLPAVADLLRSRSAGEALQQLPSTPGGGEFREALDGFLDEFGHRNEAFVELIYPRWIEDPRFPLLMVRRYLDMDEGAGPAALHEAQALRRLRLTEELAGRIADPAKAAEFRRLCHLARQRTILIEDHNFAIDQKGVSAGRVPCLALGRRLVALGCVEDVEDVFFLRLADIGGAADGTVSDLRGLVAQRRAERDRWMRVLPPTHIGEAPAVTNPMMESFFGKFKEEPDPPGTVVGIAGSPGVIRGTARFISNLSEADRLAPGEILVTYSTAPPWTPLFGIAGGIVTDAGGVQSHCAVVAREYGIPAVVGTRNGTASIEDGMTITVDGSAGIVKLEP